MRNPKRLKQTLNAHKLYTDWLYLWWIAYTNGMHGFIYIILKESLKNIPVIGWGCQFYNFIFLSRNWETDQHTFQKHLAQLNKPQDPMWLIIFPEGTNMSASTREKSRQWAEKSGLKDMKHQLLPRSTGLRFCLQQLNDTTDWLYDCTIAYEGVPEGQFGQDIFTLQTSFIEGRPPKSVNMHWRRFPIANVPFHNAKAFDVWLRNRWREKDYMLEYFRRNNKFPAEAFWKDQFDANDAASSSTRSIRSAPRPARIIETEVKSGSWNEFIKIFAPITSVITALAVAYGVSPNDLPIPGGTQFLEQHMKTLLSGAGELKGLPSPDELEKLIVKAAQGGQLQNMALPGAGHEKGQQLTQENLAKLVKETALKSGMVLPGKKMGAPKMAPSQRSKSAVPPSQRVVQKPAGKAPTVARASPTAVKSAPSKPIGRQNAKSTVNAKSKPVLSGQTKTIMTKAGVAIKVPFPKLDEAKRTGTITTKSGLVLKVGKEELEKAQKEQEKKGDGFIMTASGIPIHVGPAAEDVKKAAPAPSSGKKVGTTTASSQVGAGRGNVASVTGRQPARKAPARTPIGTKKYAAPSSVGGQKAAAGPAAKPVGVKPVKR